MKKIANQISVTLLSLFFLAACKKSEVLQSPAEEIVTGSSGAKKQESAVSKIKTRTAGTSVGIFNYDSQGRQILVSTSGGLTHVSQYEGDSVFVTMFSAGGTQAGYYVYSLNNKGLAEKADWSSFQKLYEYNTKKNLVKEETLYPNGDHNEINYMYLSGNLIEMKGYTNGAYAWTRTLTYYLDKTNNINNEAFGQAFLGVSSKNLVKSLIYSSANGTTYTITHEYEFDPQGRVANKKTLINGTPEPDDLYTYY